MFNICFLLEIQPIKLKYFFLVASTNILKSFQFSVCSVHLSVACFTVYNNVANEVKHFDNDLPVDGGGGGGGGVVGTRILKGRADLVQGFLDP